VRVRTDDEVYRVDAVWLGPPKATFPWRARYVAWGVGIGMFLLVLTGERFIGLSFGFFTVAWALIATVVLTRLICSRISHERPLGAVFTMWVRELNAPRETSTGAGGATSAARVRMHAQRPRPRTAQQRRTDRRAQQATRQTQRTTTHQKTHGQPAPRRVNQHSKRASQPARPQQHIQYVQHAQNWPGHPNNSQGSGPDTTMNTDKINIDKIASGTNPGLSAGNTTGTTTGRRGAVRPRSKEVGGVRTQGRR
jgi:hypothetical protein